MANNTYFNKIIKNGTTLIDLTGDSVAPADVAQGKTFHDASGAPQTGTASGGGGGFDWSQIAGIKFLNKTQRVALDCDGIDTSGFTNMSQMFYSTNFNSIDVSDFDTSNVTNMAFMFYYNTYIQSLDVSSFDTSSVTNMTDMFRECSNLASITFGSDWDTSAVTGMSGMFNNCYMLLDLTFGNAFDSSHVTTMQNMFVNCYRLNIPHVAQQLDMSSNQSLSSIFKGCFNSNSYPQNYGTTLDLSGWNVSNVTVMGSMFEDCHKLTEVDFSGWDTKKVAGMGSMFKNARSIVHLDLADFETPATTSIASMFYGMTALESINFPQLETTKITGSWALQNVFFSCPNLTDIIWSQKSTVQNIAATPSYMGIGSNMKFYVPDALVNDYKAATNWSTIASQIYSINDLPAALKTRYGY